MNKKGVIYILTNPSFKEYVKIGYADDVENRLRQLNNSECIPFAFRIYATYEMEDRLTDIKLHMLFESVVTNTIYYGIAFILYLCGVWTPSLIRIALLFGIGNAFDAIVSLVAYMFLLKKKKINLLDIE